MTGKELQKIHRELCGMDTAAWGRSLGYLGRMRPSRQQFGDWRRAETTCPRQRPGSLACSSGTESHADGTAPRFPG
jgi:hypothetical protein